MSVPQEEMNTEAPQESLSTTTSETMSPASNDPWGTLPDDLRGDIDSVGFKSVEDLAKGYVHASKRLGDSITIPGADATDDDRAAFRERLAQIEGVAQMPTPDDADALNALYTKLGKPEKADAYQLPEVDTAKVEEYLGGAASEEFLQGQQAFRSGSW